MCEGGGLIINLFYRGGSSNYLLMGSASNIPTETGASTVTHVIFQGGKGGGLGSDPLPLGLGSEYVQ